MPTGNFALSFYIAVKVKRRQVDIRRKKLYKKITRVIFRTSFIFSSNDIRRQPGKKEKHAFLKHAFRTNIYDCFFKVKPISRNFFALYSTTASIFSYMDIA